MKKFYLTTAIPYVNAPPHVGHALEFTQADCVARYKRLLGKDVFLTTGADENALKNVQAAEEQRITPLDLCTNNLNKFQKLAQLLNINFDIWRRGSDQKYHWPGVQKLWQFCAKTGDIYKKPYKGFYCVGCESFITEKELVDGKCPYHQKKPDYVEEENYFFRLSKYQNKILDLIEQNNLKITPVARRNEILVFIKQGLEDFSISRSKKRAKDWGIPVPGDPEQFIYVWYDALTIYMTAIGWGYKEQLWKKWWPADLHIIGKDIIRFHAVYWIGMLLSAQLPLPKSIFVHGFITSSGKKMSKSLGNVIDPFELIEEFGTDAARYYFLKEIPSHSDGDLTVRRFKEVYNADLANGLGNLVARVATLAERTEIESKIDERKQLQFYPEVGRHLEKYRFDLALSFIWEKKIRELDRLIDDRQPWNLTGKKLQEALTDIVAEIPQIAYNLKPFMPTTAEKIINQFSGKIIKGKSLFPRIA